MTTASTPRSARAAGIADGTVGFVVRPFERPLFGLMSEQLTLEPGFSETLSVEPSQKHGITLAELRADPGFKAG